jgi:hypothetical protein
MLGTFFAFGGIQERSGSKRVSAAARTAPRPFRKSALTGMSTSTSSGCRMPMIVVDAATIVVQSLGPAGAAPARLASKQG